MEKSEMLFIATKHKAKGYSIEQMRYGDDTYDASRDEKDEIAEYMDEFEAIGKIAFYEKYKEFKLY